MGSVYLINPKNIMTQLVRSHLDLKIWINSRELVGELYRITKQFPAEERFDLTSQMRRAVISIPSNIAEGAARGGTKEFIRFLYIASGSFSELETQLLLSVDLGYCSEYEVDDFREKISRIRRQIFATIRQLQMRLAKMKSVV